MIDSSLITRLKQHQPRIIDDNTNFAAVAIVLVMNADETDMLLIRRSQHPADPWSGQICLPGGRHEQTDTELVDTAIRETLEETGISLNSQCLIATLDDQQGYARGGSINLTIRPFVFTLEQRPKVIINYELDEFYWLSMSYFENAANHIAFTPMAEWPDRPGVQVDQNSVLWGMTYRILTDFFTAADMVTPFVGDYLRTR